MHTKAGFVEAEMQAEDNLIAEPRFVSVRVKHGLLSFFGFWKDKTLLFAADFNESRKHSGAIRTLGTQFYWVLNYFSRSWLVMRFLLKWILRLYKQNFSSWENLLR